ncbi:hypothetical protein ACVGWB_00125, partial [Enterobacter mori]
TIFRRHVLLFIRDRQWCGVVDLFAYMFVKPQQPGYNILVMSNGGFGGILQKLLDVLANKAEAAEE